MHADHQVPKDPRKSPGHSETAWDDEEWDRWDDDLIEDFSRWVTRIAKTCVVLSSLALAAVITLWIWSTF